MRPPFAAEPARLRAAWRALACAIVAWVWLSLPAQPDSMAVHFGVDGRADRRAPKTNHAWTMTGAVLLMGVAVDGAAALVRRLSGRWINLPNREYWLDPSRRERTVARIRILLDRFAFVQFAFLLLVAVLTGLANRFDPPRLGIRSLMTGVGIFIAGVIA